MIQILFGSVVLSVIHAAIPNHWMPFVAIGNTEKWDAREVLMATGIAGAAHVLSTILVGIIVGWLGFALYSQYEWVIYSVAPAILILLGMLYLFWDRRGNGHEHHLEETAEAHHKSKRSIIGSLVVAMFFSPCLELETYYFTAGMYGWSAIIAVSVVYLVVTVLGMMLLAYWGLRGVRKFELDILEHRDKAITGWVLIIIGLGTLLLNI